MENKEIIVDNNMIEEVEEIATSEGGNALGIMVGVGVVLLVGGLTYKFAISPLIKKIKAKKAQKAAEEIEADCDEEYEED